MNFLQKSMGLGGNQSGAVIQETPIVNFPFIAPTTTASGVTVNPKTAMEHEAVFTCVRTITSDIAKIPLQIEKRNPAGGWKVDHDHPLSDLLNYPNGRHTIFEFLEELVLDCMLNGDAFAVVIRDRMGNPEKLIPVNPYTARVYEDPQDGELFYYVTSKMLIKEQTSIKSETGETRTIYHSDIVRLRGLSLDNGKNGYSALSLAREAFGLAIATQETAARAYTNGANISGYFKPDPTLGADATMALADKIKTAIAGIVNSGKTAVLPGMDYVEINRNVSDLQLVEARRQVTSDIGRIFRVPPYKLGLNDSEKAANVAEQEQSYISNTLVQYTKPLEQHLNRVLFKPNERKLYRISFDFTKQAEPSEQVRGNYYSQALTIGWMCPDEVREREGMAPIPNGKGQEIRVPLNTGVIGDPTGLPLMGDNKNGDKNPNS
ncbi:phage portal protein [Gluconobacter sp. LMG 1744]|uniref:phage portal protein n=1 Tax=Gluconobacter cadivus TaxID=2728101 RepID=UPI001884FEA6|nr:phage portal protein [Gluconobacter cadivus]MBF0892761.1 phage portal protein [Gluconobacter cadivus]